jgi:hypothetical protein
MTDADYLSLQINCVLLLVLGTTALIERPGWFS